jgi:exosortase A-associated hydrolase 2
VKGGGLAAEFIGGDGNRILVVAHHPATFDGSCVLVCPPFAEEMNKSRRMVTELAQRAVAAGHAVVIPDLFGTGDSDGDFAQASWTRWLDDLQAAERWIVARGWRVEWLLGIRLGCLLAAAHTSKRSGAVRGTIFWQPVTDGARALEQFLRIRVAASLMRDEKETVASLKGQLTAGNVVDVAGYGLSSALTHELEKLRLADLVGLHCGQLHWFEVLRSADAPPPAPATRLLEQLSQRDVPASLHTVIGEPFWASTEIVCVPQLLLETSNVMSGT